MKGTSSSQTRAMDLTPPRITIAVMTVVNRPVAQRGMPSVSLARVEMELACTMLPMPKAAIDGEHAEEHRQPFFAQALLERVHGTAQHGAVRGLHPVFDREHRLAVLGGEAEHAGEPAPEHGPGAAQRHGGRHAHDVARADGGGQGRGERAEVAHVAVPVGVPRK